MGFGFRLCSSTISEILAVACELTIVLFESHLSQDNVMYSCAYVGARDFVIVYTKSEPGVTVYIVL